MVLGSKGRKTIDITKGFLSTTTFGILGLILLALCCLCYYMLLIWGFPKIRGTPKWMVKIMENHIKMDDLEVPPFTETPIYAGSSMLDKKKNSPCQFQAGYSSIRSKPCEYLLDQ